LCWVKVRCSIYKGCYHVSDISYLNSLPHLVSFIPLLWFLKQFQQYYFCIYIHVYTLLHLIHPPSPFPATSPSPGTNFSTSIDLKNLHNNINWIIRHSTQGLCQDCIKFLESLG
jgi:hypothetical protein